MANINVRLDQDQHLPDDQDRYQRAPRCLPCARSPPSPRRPGRRQRGPPGICGKEERKIFRLHDVMYNMHYVIQYTEYTREKDNV